MDDMDDHAESIQRLTGGFVRGGGERNPVAPEEVGRVKSLGGESKDERWVLVNKHFRCIWNHLRELWRRPDLLCCVLRLAEHHIFSDCGHFLDYGCGHSLVVIVDTFAMC